MDRCKRDGDERMNNGGVLNEDRISELPQALILHILSLLPTEEAIATSVLSKQWQCLWKMLPKLKFESCQLGTFSESVCKALLSHKALVLQSFHLIIRSNRSNAKDTTRILIRAALARNVRKLVLQVESGIWLRFPKNLYNCVTLETLKLRCIGFMEVPFSSVCLKSLRTLHLVKVNFKDEESVVNLLSGCPNLENLMVHKNPSITVKTFNIAVLSLQRLTIHHDSFELDAGYVINAPSLKYLKMDVADKYFGFCRIENVTKLVEANLIGFCVIEKVTKLVEPNITSVSEIINEKLFGCLISAKRLYLDVPPLTIYYFPTGTIFYQLVYLELYTHEADWWNVLSHMLDSSPKLQVLKLIDLGLRKKLSTNCGKWNQPETVPECLLFHLEIFMWKGYQWKQDEIEVARYILSNANRLKRATLFSKHINVKERVEMVEDLNSVVLFKPHEKVLDLGYGTKKMWLPDLTTLISSRHL